MKFSKIIKLLLVVLLFNSCEGVNKGQIIYDPSEINNSKSIELDLVKNQSIEIVAIHDVNYKGPATLRVDLDIYFGDRLIRDYDLLVVDQKANFGTSVGKGQLEEDIFEFSGKYKFTVKPIRIGDIRVNKLVIKINEK